MKKSSLFTMILLLNSSLLFAQVAVNSNNNPADGSSILDVSSTTRGLLIPRMTLSERNAISDPATGLIIFQTDDVPGLYYNSGDPDVPAWALVGNNAGLWQTNGSSIYYNDGKVGIGTDNPGANFEVRGYSTDNGTNIRIGNSDLSHFLLLYSGRENDPNPFIWWKDGDPLRFSTDQGGWSEKMRITSNGQLGIGTQTPDNSAIVDIYSTTKGFLPPRMTQAQRTAITTPAAGLLVYQTDNTAGYYYYSGANWVSVEGAGSGSNSTSTCIDYDGNAYPTFQIGTQVWMAENLRVTHYRNGDAIPNVTNGTTWQTTESGAYCWYNNNQATYAKFGSLYNFYAVEDSRGLCPNGWRVPTQTEWTTMTSYLGGESLAAGKMKSVTALWTTPNTDATNNSGFSALPGGSRDFDPGFGFQYINSYGYWWTSSEYNGSNSYYRYLSYNNSLIIGSYNVVTMGYSVRCIWDN
jgi:uncharacterized protein (TIGR02145 family)